MVREPYLVTAIRQLADLEAMENPAPGEIARLGQYRRWLARHYPDVSAALAGEYRAMRTIDEDRIREAMAEALANPGRIITR